MSRTTADNRTPSVLAVPARLFRAFAILEAVTWGLLLLGMLGKYVLKVGEVGVKVGGSLHGFAFLCYCLTTVFVAVDRRWRPVDVTIGLVCSVIPFATWPFEVRATRAGLLADRWRLLHESPAGPVERLVAGALRRPALALVGALVLVALVFAVFIVAGPPRTWFN